MSFFGFQSNSAPRARQNRETQQSELERLRGRQLASLVRAGGRAKNQAQTTFEVPVTNTQRGPLTLVLTLSKEFPMSAPHVQTNMAVQHPWLDVNGNVSGHQDLNQWTAHSDLGRIVSEIVSELKRLTSSGSPQGTSPYPTLQQPNLKQYPPTYTNPYQNYPSASSMQASIPMPPQPPAKLPQPELQRTQMPEIPAIFPELEALSIPQLEALNSDRQGVKTIVKKTSIAEEFCKLRDDVIAGNVTIAQSTLKHEEEMREIQNEIQELRSKLRTCQETLAQKQSRQQQIVARHQPDVLIEQLRTAASALDHETEDIAYRLTRGEIDLQSFLKEYLPQRSLYHERMTKLQRVLEN